VNTNSLHRHRQLWALALTLALLLLSGWGQVHRVLHPGATAASVLASAEAARQPAAHPHAEHGLGHESGGSLCLLFDHLADGTAFTSAPVLPVAGGPSASFSDACIPAATRSLWRPFDARGPPPLA